MLRSMTGYGRQESSFNAGTLSMEMRSVNHRYLELGLRLPEEVRAIESTFRERVSHHLKRGKVDLSLRYQTGSQDSVALYVDQNLAKQVINAASEVKSLMADTGNVDPMKVLSWPGVVGAPTVDSDALQSAALSLLDLTLNDFIASREREGQKTENMLVERVDAIENIVAKVREQRPAILLRLSERLKTKIGELDVVVDQGRLEQELVYAAQRLDVDEELDRLDAHVSEMRAIFKRSEPVGRRLDFLIQEFNREANTLGSKAADSDTTGFSVELKVLIEQMREQVQNIE